MSKPFRLKVEWLESEFKMPQGRNMVTVRLEIWHQLSPEVSDVGVIATYSTRHPQGLSLVSVDQHRECLEINIMDYDISSANNSNDSAI